MSTAIDAIIMGQSYKLACKEGEELALKQAVAYLDECMCAIRDAGKIKGNDRIAVMAALGMAAEFLSARSPHKVRLQIFPWLRCVKGLHLCIPC